MYVHQIGSGHCNLTSVVFEMHDVTHAGRSGGRLA